MIAFRFSFPAGRYHATPWGRHANEADVAWPPEPVRILRGLIATWWRKADHDRYPKPLLDDLVDALAAELPVFYLPPAVHTHVRSYMPAPTERKLIYDAFLRFDRDAEMVIAWPTVVLNTEQEGLCSHLLERMGYLGRAESWACAHIDKGWDGEFNSCPRGQSRGLEEDIPIDIAVPVTPTEWSSLRTKSLARIAGVTRTKRSLLEATLPERLSDALSVDSDVWQKSGWSSPPPIQKIVYDRPAIVSAAACSNFKRPRLIKKSEKPEVARFVLAGRPQPRIQEALSIGELARAALMSGGGDPPSEFSGRDSQGPNREDPAHAHAFFLPEDADGDGEIDHLIVFCRRGFTNESRRRLDRLHKLWLSHGLADDQIEHGRTEWRLALEDIAAPDVFAGSSALLRHAQTWISVTPYLMPWHAKPRFGVFEQIKREIHLRRSFPDLASVTIQDPASGSKRAIHFRRFRSRRFLLQPDRLGCFLTLKFVEPITGPLALGFGCHYGLGLFRAADEQEERRTSGDF